MNRRHAVFSIDMHLSVVVHRCLMSRVDFDMLRGLSGFYFTCLALAWRLPDDCPAL
jgi:hypothetical protein